MRLRFFVNLIVALSLIGTPNSEASEGLYGLYESALMLRASESARFAGPIGLLVVSEAPGSPAEELGVQVGDVWIGYQGRPIDSLQSFLDARSETKTEGDLSFLRDDRQQKLVLPAGRLGITLVELVELSLDPGDMALFFQLLDAGYRGDRDALTNLVHLNREAFDNIAARFSKSAETKKSGSEQLARWQETIATFIELDDKLTELENKRASLDAQRANRGELLREIEVLQVQVREATESGDLDEAILGANRWIELARALPIPENHEGRQPTQALARIQEANALLHLAGAKSAKGAQVQAVTAAQSALDLARSLSGLLDPGGEQTKRFLSVGLGIESTALDLVSTLHSLLDNHEAVRQSAEQRLKIAVTQGDQPSQVDALATIAAARSDSGELLLAIPVLEEATALARALDDPRAINRVEMALATVHLNLGAYEQATLHLHKALDAARRLPHRTGKKPGPVSLDWYAQRETMALDSLGQIALWQGDTNGGKTYFEEAKNVAEDFFAGTERESDVLASLSIAHALAGETEEAIGLIRRALDLHRKGHSAATDRLDRGAEALLQVTFAEILITAGQHEKAQAVLNEAERLTAPIGDDLTIAIGIAEARAHSLCIQDDFAQAERLLRGNIERTEHFRRSLSAAELTQVSFSDLYVSNYDLLQYALLKQGREEDLLLLAEERRARRSPCKRRGRENPLASPWMSQACVGSPRPTMPPWWSFHFSMTRKHTCSPPALPVVNRVPRANCLSGRSPPTAPSACALEGSIQQHAGGPSHQRCVGCAVSCQNVAAARPHHPRIRASAFHVSMNS